MHLAFSNLWFWCCNNKKPYSFWGAVPPDPLLQRYTSVFRSPSENPGSVPDIHSYITKLLTSESHTCTMEIRYAYYFIFIYILQAGALCSMGLFGALFIHMIVGGIMEKITVLVINQIILFLIHSYKVDHHIV